MIVTTQPADKKAGGKRDGRRSVRASLDRPANNVLGVAGKKPAEEIREMDAVVDEPAAAGFGDIRIPTLGRRVGRVLDEVGGYPNRIEAGNQLADGAFLHRLPRLAIHGEESEQVGHHHFHAAARGHDPSCVFQVGGDRLVQKDGLSCL